MNIETAPSPNAPLYISESIAWSARNNRKFPEKWTVGCWNGWYFLLPVKNARTAV